ncbi:MAG: NAD(P)-dependent oxidoreductase [Phaeodactylibacter sp.]|nr:NAD(P)-dependent oxidoreductase [Phaeodactylibacter sp.]MCB9276968.1 NAD(P)-dependent oxidoreductase [Lewinellaceae bacterium]
MKVFIAGATGLLGKRVAKLLVEQGYEVAGLARSDANRELLRALGAEARFGSLFDKQQMIEATQGCDAILHLATKIPGKARTKPRDWLENDRIRTEGADALADAAIHHKMKLYLQQSILFIYGNQQGRALDSHSPIPVQQPYFLQSAVAMEDIVNEKARNSGLPAITLRFASFYGAESGQTRGMVSAIRKGKFPIVGKGDYFYNLIHLDDAASAVAFAVNNYESLPHRVVNVSDFHPSPFAEVVEHVASITESRKPGHIPVWLARLLLGREMAGILAASYQNRLNAMPGWKPEYASYREGFAQVVAALDAV